jgi:hypothetical protein
MLFQLSGKISPCLIPRSRIKTIVEAMTKAHDQRQPVV